MNIFIIHCFYKYQTSKPQANKRQFSADAFRLFIYILLILIIFLRSKQIEKQQLARLTKIGILTVKHDFYFNSEGLTMKNRVSLTAENYDKFFQIFD